MKSSALLRNTVLLCLLALMPAPAVHAGSLNSVFGTALNDPTTPNDDMMLEVPLLWYPGGHIQFYYQSNMDGRTVLSGDVMDGFGNRVVNDPGDILTAVQRAIHRWNSATYVGARKFSMFESLIDTKTIVPQQLPDGINSYVPTALAVDGYNFIDFQATQNVAAGGPAMTVISYFSRDFPLAKMVNGAIPNPQVYVNVITNQGGAGAGGAQAYAFTNWNYVGQQGAGGQNQAPVPMRLFIPLQDYKQGNVFDIDIALNDSQLQYFRAWPATYDQVPVNQRDEVERNLDLEMVFMHELGWAMGLGNSMIFDSVMYPYYNTRSAGNEPDFVTDQFRKRLLSFDDQMTAGMAWSASFPKTLGSISGEIMDGNTVGSQTPLSPNGTQQNNQQPNAQPGPQQTNTQATVDPFLAQVPVFVGVRSTDLAKMPPILTSGRADLRTLHADNILSNSPYDPADTNRGDWRMMAHVLSGQELAIPASQGPAQPGGTGGGPGGGEPGGGGGGGGTGGTSVPGPDLGTISQVSRINGLYIIPGLPDKDINGAPIDYAVWLPSSLRTGTTNSFFCNVFRSQFIPTQTAGFYTFNNEFYGGVDMPFQFGQGNAPISTNPNDDLFMSNYIIGEMDYDGRIAAAINQGPGLLSGYQTGPNSFIVLSTPDKYYTNHLGAIAPAVQPVLVTDLPIVTQPGVPNLDASQATGIWEEPGKFRIRAQMKLSISGGLSGLPAGLEVIYSVTNLANAPTSMSLRQVLDTDLFGREHPVYFVNNKVLDYSTTWQNGQIPRQVVFQSWSTSSTAIRGWVETSGALNTPPNWMTIGTLGELNQILAGPGLNLRDMASINYDSGIALGWNFLLNTNEQKVVRFTFGYFPGGRINDSWIPYPTNTGTGTTLSGFEDDPHKILPVHVSPGKVTDGIDIYTNTGSTPSGITPQPTPVPGKATGLLQFIRLANGFPDEKTYYTTGGALGDLDNDGDLDAVTCAINGGNPSSGALNRIYLNEQRVNSDGTVSRYFREVTLGDDVNDPSTYRLSPPHQGEDTYGVVLGDFDDDGWLEIFFTKRGAPNRYYDNLGPEKPAYFLEDEAAVPGLLNGPVETSLDYPFRAAAGDIDSDGDLDLIISQFDPITMQINAWLDADGGQGGPDERMSHDNDRFSDLLRYNERVLINYKYTPTWAARFNMDLRQERTDQLGTYFLDETLGTDDWPGTLTSLHTERFDNIAQYQYVVSWDPSELDRMAPLFPAMWNANDQLQPQNLQASPMGMHAVEPRLGPLFGGSALDLMSVRATQNLFRDVWSGMPIPFATPWTPTPPSYVVNSAVFLPGNTGGATAAYDGCDSAYFRNMDMFSNRNSTGTPMEVVGDGIPDGYFACMNYNMDYGTFGQPIISSSMPREISTRFGLFVYEQDNATSSNRSLFRYDAFPLFIGFPDGHQGDTPKSPWATGASFTDHDIVPAQPATPVNNDAYCGLIGNWENVDRPMPLVLTNLTDTVAAGPAQPYLYSFPPFPNSTFSGSGCRRGFGGDYGGYASSYVDSAIYPYTYVDSTGYAPWSKRTLTNATGAVHQGQPYGAASADFDLDGDEDLFWVNSGQARLDFNWQNPKAPKQMFTNDSFGVFTEAANALWPNEPINGMYCAVGDLDNDSDPDLVSFNMLGPNEAYLNQAFTQPPNPLNQDDPTMFFDATYKVIPNVSALSFTGPNFWDSIFSGVTLGAAIGDLNLDGRPDIVTAESGKLSRNGGYARVMINGGQPVGDAVQVFKPGGAAYPAPRADLWVHNLTAPDGYFTLFNNVKHWTIAQRQTEQFFGAWLQGYLSGELPSFITDMAVGDADNDGDPDLLVVRSGGQLNFLSDGPQLLTNMDSDEEVLNSNPDTDSKGDGIFVDGNLIRLTDPDNPARPSNEVFKNQGQKAKFADFDGDGLADIVIANGYPNDQLGRGAPNVILMNGRPVAGRFADETESRLPTVVVNNVKRGIHDNTLLLAVGDFDSDGDIDILFGNQSAAQASLGFRMMLNNGSGYFTEVPQGTKIPTFNGRKIQGIAVADLDGLGEPTEDKNFNGLLDPGEDTNGNGRIDWTDLPTETEDLNNNGRLDPGEDGLIGAPNGKLDYQDLNGDRIYTARRAGMWDGSIDIVVTCDQELPSLLINNPSGNYRGLFHEESSTRLFNAQPGPDRGLDIGDINLDGHPDIVIAQYVGGITYPVKVWLNQPSVNGSQVRWGYFKDVTHEVPFPWGQSDYSEASQNILGPNDASFFGWYNDVKLLDMEGDGDLDMLVCGMGVQNLTSVVGTRELFYINRVVGDGYNFKGYDVQANKTSPSVLSIWPRGASRGAALDIKVAGENFQSGTLLSFGPGVNVRHINKVDTSNLTVSINVDTTATLGPRAVLAQNPSGAAVASKVGLFNVYENLPNEVDDRTWSLYN